MKNLVVATDNSYGFPTASLTSKRIDGTEIWYYNEFFLFVFCTSILLKKIYVRY